MKLNQKTTLGILVLIVLAEVYLILRNPWLFEQHYHVLFIVPAAAVAYFLVIYSQKKLTHLAKSNHIITPQQHKHYIETEGKKLTHQLMASQEFEKLKAVKLGQAEQHPLSSQKLQEQNSVVKELEQLEKVIFAD